MVRHIKSYRVKRMKELIETASKKKDGQTFLNIGRPRKIIDDNRFATTYAFHIFPPCQAQIEVKYDEARLKHKKALWGLSIWQDLFQLRFRSIP